MPGNLDDCLGFPAGGATAEAAAAAAAAAAPPPTAQVGVLQNVEE